MASRSGKELGAHRDIVAIAAAAGGCEMRSCQGPLPAHGAERGTNPPRADRRRAQ